MSDSDQLALFGGRPVRPQWPPDWPLPDEDVLASLEAAYRDGSWGRYEGKFVGRLEQQLADYHGVAYASVCASGTYAVEWALRALPVQPGDEVILAGYDFPGNYENVLAVGARPVVVDVTPRSGCLDPNQLAEAVGAETRAILVSHLHGGVAAMGRIVAFAQEHQLSVIEDAAQMPGALIEGRRAGTWGDVGILSFGGSKLLTAGRGGAILTRHRDVHHRARLVSWRGNRVAPLSELQAAALLPQLAKLDARNRRRAAAVERLCEGFRQLPLDPFENEPGGNEPGYYKWGLRFQSAGFGGLEREAFIAAMRAEGIAMDAGFRDLSRRRSGGPRKIGALEQSRRTGAETVVLHHPVLLGDDQAVDQVIRAAEKVRAAARGGWPGGGTGGA